VTTVKKTAKKKTAGKVGKIKADKADRTDKADNDNVDKSLKSGGVLAGRELVDAIVSVLEDKLAERIAVIDLRKVAAAADWFIVCSGDNTSHTTATANEVIGALKQRYKTAPWHYEGIEDGRWALIDYTDVVVHVMLGEVREYYNLEGLWG
jgi:ribosome-associated protein